jgi:hypothetical protein
VSDPNDTPEANPSPDPLPTRVREHLHPVDLPGSQFIGGHPLRWTSGVIATATLFLALTNAISLHGWAAELPPTAFNQRLVDITARWQAITDAVGLGAPRAAVHGVWKQGQAARFGSQPAEGEPTPG